jgi:hypothetical protein
MSPISVKATERAVHRSHADRFFSLAAALSTIKKEIDASASIGHSERTVS